MEACSETLMVAEAGVSPPAASSDSGRPFRPLAPAPGKRRPQRSSSRSKLQGMDAPPSPDSTSRQPMPTILGSRVQKDGGYQMKPKALDSPPKSPPVPYVPAFESLPLTPSTAASALTPPITPTPAAAGLAMVGSPCRALRKRSESGARLRRPSRPSVLEPLVGLGLSTGPPIRLSPSTAMSWRADKALFVDTFNAFCGNMAGLNVTGFALLCKHCFLIDIHFTYSDAEQLFLQVVQDGCSEITLNQFEAALYLIAKQKGIPFDTVRRAVTLTGGPTLPAVCSAAGLPAPEADEPFVTTTGAADACVTSSHPDSLDVPGC